MDFGSQGMYHIGLKPEQGAAYALLTGDPGRVEAVASRLEEPAFVCANREYTTWVGRLQGSGCWPSPMASAARPPLSV